MTEPNFDGEFNEDAGKLSSILEMMDNMSRDKQQTTLETPYRLKHLELNNLFSKHKILRKVVTRYPHEAESTGYRIKDKDGNVVQDSDSLIIEAFREASIYSRIYGKALLIFEFNSLDNKPLKKGELITGYRIDLNIQKDGDFFHFGADSDKVHYTKALVFIGQKNYIPTININNPDFADSIIQSLYDSFMDYLATTKYAQYLLENLSYLLVGIHRLGEKTSSREGKLEIFSRMTSLNENRKVNRTIAYDKDGESVSFISQTLAGITDIIQEIKALFITETDYPSDILFEESQNNGLSSGMQNQLAGRFLWKKRVVDWTKQNWYPNYNTLFSRLIEGFSEMTLEIPFNMDMTPMEQAELESKAAERSAKLIESKIIIPTEARIGYKSSQFTLNLLLDDKEYKKEMEKHEQASQSPVTTKQIKLDEEKALQNQTEITDLEFNSIKE